MHPRSPYANATPNFVALAKSHASLTKYVHVNEDGSGFIDFHNADAVRELTAALLWTDFKIMATQATDRLCPMVPNRLNYVLWIQDVVAETRRVLALVTRNPQAAPSSDEASERPAKRRKRDLMTISEENRGLDIGTGASAIYPLLMCATNPQAQMLGTDIDATSLDHARGILEHPANAAHRFPARISLQLRKPEDPLLPIGTKLPAIQGQGGPAFHFTMCNPPFFASRAEMEAGQETKAAAPSAVCTGTPGEMVYAPAGKPVGPSSMDSIEDAGCQPEGGEVGFVGRMIEESLRLHRSDRGAPGEGGGQDDVWWYTSMLGRLSSVDTLLQRFKGPTNASSSPPSLRGSADQSRKADATDASWVVHELVQGRTKRWVLAWTFTGVQLSEVVVGPVTLARHRRPGLIKERLLRQPGEDLETVKHALRELLRSIEDVRVSISEDEQSEGRICIDVIAWSASWTRAARRARQRAAAAAAGGNGANATGSSTTSSTQAVLAASFVIRHEEPATMAVAPVAEEERAVTLPSSDPHVAVDVRWTFGHSRALFDSFAQHVRSAWASMHAQS